MFYNQRDSRHAKQRYDLIQIYSVIIKHTYVLRFKRLFDYKTYMRFNTKETLRCKTHISFILKESLELKTYVCFTAKYIT